MIQLPHLRQSNGAAEIGSSARLGHNQAKQLWIDCKEHKLKTVL